MIAGFARRRLMQLLGGCLSAATIFGPRWAASRGRTDPVEALLDAVAERAALRRVGLRLLHEKALPAGRDELAHILFEDAPPFRADWDRERRRAWLAERVADDFARRRLCRIDGWILARSEAALAALAARSRGSVAAGRTRRRLTPAPLR